jgi:cytochrome c oxidase accessory protein FixG
MKELPKDRLATTDETGKRVYLYPASVEGKFRNWRNLVHGILVVIFLILPWLHWDGRQLFLLNVAKREFHLFSIHLRAHDAPLLLFLFLSFAFFIGFITAVWGRVWCGWACPQTVFIEGIFRKIENFIEGNHRERKALDDGPWNEKKVFLKVSKYLAFLFVSLIITHSFLAYFVGSEELLKMITSPPLENWTSFLVILFTTGIILLDFGWFREQFCVIMCPYGRFQSVLLDGHSTVVGYDTARGEPRKGTESLGSPGDCVNCFRCVQVCPTGIDIRRGQQMECIHCTACIDACDAVMEKVQKPLGLIRYTSEVELMGRARKIFRPRTAIYVLLFSVSFFSLGYALQTKDYFEIAVLRAKEIPYQIVNSETGEKIINHFRLDLSNQTGADVNFEILRPENSEVELIMPQNPVLVPQEAHLRLDFFLRYSRGILENGTKKFKIKVKRNEIEQTLEVPLVGPNS